jgi:hypothetical protein
LLKAASSSSIWKGLASILVEHLAFLDVAPLLEIAAIDDAGYAGANLGDSSWGNAPRQLANDRQRRRLKFDDADFLGGGCSLALGCGGPLAAAGQGRREQHRDGGARK